MISIAILTITSLFYIRLPQLLGFEQYDVTADFADATGLYENAIVTYRGAQVGRVDAVNLGRTACRSCCRWTTAPTCRPTRPPPIHSTSAIGEQYIDLVPDAARRAATCTTGRPSRAAGPTASARPPT